MTAVLSSGGHFLPFEQFQMNDHGANDAWRRQYVQQMSVPANHWQDNSNSMPIMTHGMLENDLRMFQSAADATTFDASYSNNHHQQQAHHHINTQLVSPRLAFPPDASWGSDMEINTPSTAGFPSNIDDGYTTMRHTSAMSSNNHLNLPHSHHERALSNGDSPNSSYSGISQPSQYLASVEQPLPEPTHLRTQRPGIMRAITAPENIVTQRRHDTLSPPIKRSTSDDEDVGIADDDDDYMPSASNLKAASSSAARGRKRQRIPHTAVERRYRENLNAHLDKLRQTVPSLATLNRGPVLGKGKGEGDAAGPKPSKCEILNGAIEHIGALGKENHALKMESKALRARLDELERWLAQR
jgi:hypothetical protein